MKFWIARDIYNGLNLFKEKPVKPNPSGYNCYYSNDKVYKIDDELFPEIKDGDEPKLLEMKICE